LNYFGSIEPKEPIQEVAYFKYYIVEGKEGKNIDKQLKKMKMVFSNIRTYLARLYVLEAREITCSSNDELPDCYIIVKMGKKVINDKYNIQNNTRDPKFYSNY